MSVDRRGFIALGAAGAAGLAMPSIGRGQSKGRVVVVGGGAGGVPAARTMSALSNGTLDVTLIEPKKTYTTCFFSNLYLADFRSFPSITHSYSKLKAADGINVIHEYATQIDRDKQLVILASGDVIEYDRLVLSPGIDFDFDTTPGYSAEDVQIAPHAWQAGEQTQLLKRKLDAIEDGQQIIILPPAYPYRCPPGPYERASMMAHLLTTKGHTNSRITILDPKPSFSKQALFSQGWEQHYPGMIEWLGPDIHGGIINIDAKSGVVETDFDDFEGDLINVIPGQLAGKIARSAQLVDGTGFCEIDGSSMRSKLDPNIYVIGDSCVAGKMPKSAFSANSQAKVCARNVVADLTGADRGLAEFGNACFSLISDDNGAVVSATFVAQGQEIVSISSHVSQLEETNEERAATFAQSLEWYADISGDMFG